jgi:hypothetical protein
MFQTVIYGWIFGVERGEKELHEGAHIRVPYVIQIVLKYIAPAYLFFIFGMFCYQSMPERIVGIREDDVALMSVCFIAIVFAFLVVLVRIAGKRWEREGRLRLD